MPQEMIPLLECDETAAQRHRAEAAMVHEAAIEALLRLGATRRPEPSPEEFWQHAA